MSLAIAMPSTSSSARSAPKMRSALSALLAQSGGSSCVSVLMMRRFWSAAVVRSEVEARALERGADRCTLLSTETARRFYRSAGYGEDGLPQGKFGTSSSYPKSKRLTGQTG